MFFLVGIVLVLAFWLVPIKIGALAVGAGRTTFGACLLALLVSWFFVMILTMGLRHGVFLSVLTSALAYKLVLDTTYVKGLAIAAIQLVVTWLFVLAIGVAIMGPVVNQVFRV